MARVRSPARDKAKEMYLAANGDIRLVDIAAELNIKDTQVRKWKSQDKWEQELKGTLPKSKRNVTNKKVNIENKRKESIAKEVKEVLENTELTEKQRLFCIYYIEHFNATKAYQKAYACNYDAAMSNGNRLLRNDKVKKEINRLTKECLEEQEVNAKLLNKRLFEMYLKIAFADIGDYLKFGKERKNLWKKDDDGNDVPVIDPETGEQKYSEYNYILLNESSELDTTLITEVSEGKDGVKIKLQDKMKALEWLDKHYGEGTEEQKLKISKLKGEVSKLENGYKDKPIEILIKRKERD